MGIFSVPACFFFSTATLLAIMQNVLDARALQIRVL
jgi:hypothetical protein